MFSVGTGRVGAVPARESKFVRESALARRAPGKPDIVLSVSTPLDSIKVVYASPRCVVIDKPPGVLSVPGKGEHNRACVATWAQARFPRATGPITVHRLDMDTSGLLVVALDPEAQRELSRQFEAREVEKEYTAVAEGMVACDRGVIDAPLRPDPTNRPMQVIDREFGRPARTRYEVRAFEFGHTRLTLVPETGRTHQLRVHCALIGHPILGDVLYGDAAAAERMLLHASRLCFTDPERGQRVEVHCPAPF
ncbi:RluA family pseudouridine synthase [soil metagenome]